MVTPPCQGNITPTVYNMVQVKIKMELNITRYCWNSEKKMN